MDVFEVLFARMTSYRALFVMFRPEKEELRQRKFSDGIQLHYLSFPCKKKTQRWTRFIAPSKGIRKDSFNLSKDLPFNLTDSKEKQSTDDMR